MESNDNTWGVYAKPSYDFDETINLMFGSGQITLLVNHGDAEKIKYKEGVTGSWGSTAIVRAPIEAPHIDYVSFQLNGNRTIPTKNQKEFLLFTFQSDTCLDTLGIIENDTDPYAALPNSTSTNPLSDLSGLDLTNRATISTVIGNYAHYAHSCQDCDEDGIPNALEDTNGDGVFTPTVDVSNLCNNDNNELDTPAALPEAAQKACITINDVTFKSPSGCGATDGSITVNAVHESGNTLQYSLDGGRVWQNTSTLEGLEAGVAYNLELRDNIGLCFESYGEIVLENTNCVTDPCVARPFTIADQPDETICSGGSIQLRASSGVQYSWSPSAGLSATDIATPTASPTSTTTYTVIVSNAEGCTATDDITVTIAAGATANAGIDQTICAGSSAQLTATGGSTYSWIPETGLSNSTIANPIASPTITTTYMVIVTDRNGCADSDQVTVAVANSLTVDLGADQTVCSDEEYDLNATGGISYSWSPTDGLDQPSAANPTATITQTITYCVTVTDANGCTGTDCINFEVDDNCEGEDMGGESGSGNTFNPCIVGPAIVGCPDKFMCANDQVQLVVNGGIRWEWSPATGLDDPTSSIPIASPTQTTTYTVTGWDANGCSATDEVLVTVITNGNCGATSDCQDDSLLEESKICMEGGVNAVQICLPYLPEDLDIRYTINTANGAPTVIHGCNFEDIYGYQYNFLPEGGQGVDYRIKSWAFNNTIQTGVINSVQELATFMQNLDPAGNWILDPTRFSIIGGNTSTTYGDLTIDHPTTATETVIRKNTTQTPTGILVEIDMTNKDREVLTFKDLITGCTDQIIIERQCQ